MESPRIPLRAGALLLAAAFAMLDVATAGAQLQQPTWITRVPPERLLQWHPKTVEEAAHPEVLFGTRPPRMPETRATQVNTPSVVASGDYSWSEIGPPARMGHLMVLDTRRHRVIVVGGRGAYDPAGNVWARTLPSGDWSLIAHHPFGTTGTWGGSTVAAAAYDSLRDQLLIAPTGGTLQLYALPLSGGATTFTQIWSGPASPSGFDALAIDTYRDQACFLAVWDPGTSRHRIVRVPLSAPASWTSVEILGSQPPAASFGDAVYNPARDEFDVVLGAGQNPGSGGTLAAIEIAVAPTWRAVPAFFYSGGGPTHLCLDAAAGRLLLLNDGGGILSLTPGPDTPGQWLTRPNSSTRYVTACAFDPAARRLYVNGGSTGSSMDMPHLSSPLFVSAAVDSGDAYVTGQMPNSSKLASWLPVDPIAPVAGAGSDSLPRVRFGQFAAVDPVRQVMMWYGGQALDGTGDLLGDLWLLPQAPGSHWQRVFTTGPNPGQRRGNVCLYDSANDRFLLIGGDDLHSYFLDAWELKLDPVPTWRHLTLDGGFAQAQNVFLDEALGGGWCVTWGTNPFRRVTWDADVVHYQPVTPDLPSYYYSGLDLMGFDPDHRRLMWIPDHGGYNMDLTQLVTTDLAQPSASWQSRPLTGTPPGPRYMVGSRYDRANARLVISGGGYDNGPYFGDTWAVQMPIDLPTAASISLADFQSGASGITLRWSLDAPMGTACTVEHSSDGTAWADAGAASWIGSSEVRFDGAPLAAGTREAFRLRIGGAVGNELSDVVWLTGVAVDGLAFAPIANPSRGAPTLRLAAPLATPARMRLLDVSGRVVRESAMPAGTQRWSPDSAPAPGLYFAELTAGAQRRVARVVIAP